MVGSNEQNAIRCTRTVSVTPSPPLNSSQEASSSASFHTNFRIRGDASDLYINRSGALFGSASQATGSLSSDGVTGKTTSTIQGVIGYNIPLHIRSTSGERLSIIPYVGVDRVFTTVSPGKTGGNSATEILSGGVIASIKFTSGTWGHQVNLRPTFTSNLQDDSSIASLNLQYLPVLDGWINAFTPVRIPGLLNFSLRPILDFRVDAGAYTNRGDVSVRADNRDFVRLGGQAGVSLVSDDERVPIELRSTYTGLYGASGKKNIGLFENSLAWNLVPEKYIQLTLKYSNGNREDTAEREQKWLAGISVRY